jgi:hypothetical protein
MLTGKAKSKIPLGQPMRRCKDKIEMCLNCGVRF